jgi:hypothetical protein
MTVVAQIVRQHSFNAFLVEEVEKIAAEYKSRIRCSTPTRTKTD